MGRGCASAGGEGAAWVAGSIARNGGSDVATGGSGVVATGVGLLGPDYAGVCIICSMMVAYSLSMCAVP